MVIVVPEIDQYKFLTENLRYKTIKNLNPAKIVRLIKTYPYADIEIREGLNKTLDLFEWIFKNEYSEEIKKIAKKQIKKLKQKDILLLYEIKA